MLIENLYKQVYDVYVVHWICTEFHHCRFLITPAVVTARRPVRSACWRRLWTSGTCSLQLQTGVPALSRYQSGPGTNRIQVKPGTNRIQVKPGTNRIQVKPGTNRIQVKPGTNRIQVKPNYRLLALRRTYSLLDCLSQNYHWNEIVTGFYQNRFICTGTSNKYFMRLLMFSMIYTTHKPNITKELCWYIFLLLPQNIVKIKTVQCVLSNSRRNLINNGKLDISEEYYWCWNPTVFYGHGRRRASTHLHFSPGVELLDHDLCLLHVLVSCGNSPHPRVAQRLVCRQPLLWVHNQQVPHQVLIIVDTHSHHACSGTRLKLTLWYCFIFKFTV